jgi:uncharacterized secreted protein with C-terminal beta-propeller domain
MNRRLKRLSTVGRTSLHLERLEDRCLMNGDPAPVEAALEIAPFPANQLVAADDVAYIGGWWPGIYNPSPTPPGSPLFETVDDMPAWLIEEIDNRYGQLFGTAQTGFHYGWWGYPRISNLLLFNTSADAAGLTTNLQEAGVDEADLIETDGEYVYVISGQDLVIVDASDPENLSIASRVRLTERPVGMYLSEGRLTIIGTNDAWSPLGQASLMFFGDWRPSYHHRPMTTVTVLDVADPRAPTQVQKTELDGSLVSSRMVDGQLRIVVQQRSMNLADYLPQIYFETTFNEDTQQYQYAYESRDSYLKRVRNTLRDSLVPQYRTLDVNNQVLHQESLVPLSEMLSPTDKGGCSMTTIATFDTLGDTAGPSDAKTVRTTHNATIYATEDNLYVMGQDFWNPNSWNDTSIWKFSFEAENGSIELEATGRIAGSLLNQFSVDEHDGYLRVVTGDFSDQKLSVLKQEGAELAIVGQITGLAPGETIYSVRFAENRAYVVTFRRIDPLFVVDLADPTSPKVLGELKIPGFTDYLHFLDDNHLIGVGRGANETTGWFEELQISIFKVTNANAPELLHRFSLGDSWTTTPVTGGQWTTGDGDHHAFNYFAEEGILAIPVENLSGNNGLQILRVDLAMGLEAVTFIEHETPILRSLKLGDKLVAISAGKITVHDMADPAATVEELDIAASETTMFTGLAHFVNLRALSEGTWIEVPSLSTGPSLRMSDQVFDELAVASSEHRQDFVAKTPIPVSSREEALESDVKFALTSNEEPEEQAWDLALEFSKIL